MHIIEIHRANIRANNRVDDKDTQPTSSTNNKLNLLSTPTANCAPPPPTPLTAPCHTYTLVYSSAL